MSKSFKPLRKTMREWRMLVGTLSIALVTIGVVLWFNWLYKQSLENFTLLSKVSATTHRLSSMEWHVEATRTVSLETLAEVDSLDRELAGNAALLSARVGDDKVVADLLHEVSHFTDGIYHLFELFHSGEFERAHAWDEAEVDPAYDALLIITAQAEDDLQKTANRWQVQSTWGAGLSIFVGALVTGLMTRRFSRIRLDNELLRAEHHLLVNNEQRFRGLIQNASDVFAVLDPQGVFQYQSPTCFQVHGHPPERFLSQPIFDFVHPDNIPAVRDLIREALFCPRTSLSTEVRMRLAGGEWGHFEVFVNNLLDDSSVGGIVATFRDITKAKAAQQELTYLAFHDPLTHLPNRVLFLDRLEQGLLRAAAHQMSVAVLFIDLDNFKFVNDSLGHEAGDELLEVVGERFRQCLNAQDTLARLGGDEFTVLLEGTEGLATAIAAANRIYEALQGPIAVQGRDLYVKASIGIAVSDTTLVQPESLLRNADLAMYRAKRSGKGRYAVFDQSVSNDIVRRMELDLDLHHALEQGQFTVYYQPIVQLQSRGVVAAEALIRWEHPRFGTISPAEFIPLAEETGLIIAIGRWVLNEACRTVRAWQLRYPANPPVTVNVNLSAKQLYADAGLIDDVRTMLAETGLKPEYLQLEITESVIVNMEAAAETLHHLKKLGVRLAMDDFGTGYSSLAQIQTFPLDAVKIDRSFMDLLGRERGSRVIIDAILRIAETLNLTVTAEGIETPEQSAELQAMGCKLGQGFYFCKPLPADEMAIFLRKSLTDDFFLTG